MIGEDEEEVGVVVVFAVEALERERGKQLRRAWWCKTLGWKRDWIRLLRGLGHGVRADK